MTAIAQDKTPGFAPLREFMARLRLPAPKASPAQWQAFVDTLRRLMIQHRNIGHEWNLTEEQWRRLQEYDTATILLAECLRLAAVSNRKEIEESLLLPPNREDL
ncbi:MAG: hypothetical protein FJ030_19205 [Chloroflexi bacterium]|nr:hypothetical protein [Chloroflexota bacterium]